jgi:hypothetical protein
MAKQLQPRLVIETARKTWTAGLIAICLLFILTILTTLIIRGDFSVNIFGVEAYRVGNATGVKIGWDAAVGFLLVIPTIAAGLSLYRSRR